ncbi:MULTISPECIES: ribosomal protein S18-alanine N-acetyltransferase [unclassified Undibacterium]|uniref:ribosomal protein S18-alanine N-acetyltransferase n=1 Tax=unclassified Undibacterium TaxID=2630295 RepID=UPI002AC99227|nr:MULTISPECIES: ribosomal protein S18-alanine N-acetyltransferase [unclassified Undibacterium]MEB0138061.1 ribosomal protein S18-alanine N-acetyltransferase [Undibacterium sp. CCC2.1]MEB0171201.1 ribosomal protein S18-alanine N-acetyltransferase [Undibacterium sp. CCC1.1]MEB0175246.1 ribosomal protein S18-alanine N-acetyltransferase [Undibacterium sp. CCC3.4]MEB0214654.1 ribosomal protein S18-alanine N-acetyltransferase [Undibacterium sp. 5I2]WPX42421.1 ribosomal protein S18-alanine N-acetylt
MLTHDFVAFVKLGYADIDTVLSLEVQLYPHPWTRGNFTDSLQSGHAGFGLRDAEHGLIAYCFVMPVLEELHLLNFAVAGQQQKQGYAREMLNLLHDYAIEQGFASMLLEVRRSNARALAVYRSDGFLEIGCRKAYYPAAEAGREDAIVMRRIYR